MGSMTYEECKEFILEEPRPAVVAVVRHDGRPHCAPVWIDLDGDEIMFTTGRDTLKGKALLRDPRISLCVDDDRPPFSYVIIEGTATLTEDLDDLRYWAGRLGGRYMGQDRAEEYGKRNGVPGEMLVRVKILRATGFRNIAE